MHKAVAVPVRSGRLCLGCFLFFALFLTIQLSASAAGSVTLAWDSSTDPLVVGYNIYYGGASATYTNTISVGTATNVTINGLVPGTTYYFAATTYNAANTESEFSSEVSYLVPQEVVGTSNHVPTLNAIGNFSINENAGQQTVSLSGISSGAANENQTLTVTATSGNTGLIPNPTVNYSSPNTNGSLNFTPAVNGNGSALITVKVNDGGASNNIVTRTFTVTVNPVNQAPTLNPIGNLSINENAGLQTVNLSGISSGAANEIQTLTVTATSSNTGLVPNPTVTYTSANPAGTLKFTPAVNGNGSAVITVKVNDGGASNNIVTQTFTVTVNAVNQPPTLNPIGNLSMNENAGLQTVNLSGISSGAANENQTLTVTATSSNTGLVPNPAVTYTSANPTGNLTFTPVTDATGTAIVTVQVNDGGTSNNIVSRTFSVTLNAVSNNSSNSAPTLDPIPDIVVNAGGAMQKVNLTGITSGTAGKGHGLRLTVNATNPRLVSHLMGQFSAHDSIGWLTFRPGSSAGTTTIAVTVDNNERSNNIVTRSFTVTQVAAGASTNLAASASSTDMTTPSASDAPVTVKSLGYAAGRYTLTVAGSPGYKPATLGTTYVIEASTDLVHWVPVKTNTVPFTFEDPYAGQYNHRFYRVVPLP